MGSTDKFNNNHSIIVGNACATSPLCSLRLHSAFGFVIFVIFNCVSIIVIKASRDEVHC